MEIFNTWQFNLVAYLCMIVLFFQFNRLAVKDAKDNAAATLLLQGVALIASAVLIPFFPFTLPAQLGLYGLLILASIFYALNDRLQTPIRKHLQVSFFTIINQLVYVVLFIYGLLIYHEDFTLSKLIGISLIIMANVLLLYKKGVFQINRFVIFAFVAAVALATAISIDVGVSQNFNLPLYIALTLLLPGLMIMTTEKVSYKRIADEYQHANIKTYIIAGCAWAATIFFALRALQLGDFTTVVPLQALSVILNVLVAYVFLKERNQIVRKLLAASIVIGGIILLTVG